MELEKEFRDQLKAARKAWGYTQEQVAEAVSVSSRWYNAVERGRGVPNAALVLRLQIFLHLDPQDLRGAADISQPPPSRRQLQKKRRQP